MSLNSVISNAVILINRSLIFIFKNFRIIINLKQFNTRKKYCLKYKQLYLNIYLI